jgi:tRNA threonylcarbamoyladenosine biosynthesis protein TsaE
LKWTNRSSRPRSRSGAAIDDYLTPDAVAFIEWPAVGEPTIEAAIAGRGGKLHRIEIRHAGGDDRVIELSAG